MRSFYPTTTLTFAFALLLAVACGDDDTPGPTDGGGGTDTGPAVMDGGGTDAGGTDAGTMDAGPMDDAGDTDSGGDDAGPIVGTDYVYYYGDFATDGVFNVGRWDIAAAANEVLAPMGLTDADDIMAIDVSADGTRLAVAGRATATDPPVINVYAADGTGAPTTIVTGPMDRIVEDVKFSPDGTWIAWTAAFETAGNFDDNDDALYAAPSDGSGTPTRLSPDVPANNLVVSGFTWATNTHIVFTGDVVTNNVDSIWSVEVTGPGTPVELVDSSTFPGTTQDIGELVDVDGMGRVYFVGDFAGANNEFHLYRNALDGSSFEEVTGTALTNGDGSASVGTFGISNDGATLAFAADAPTTDKYEVYVMALATATPMQVSAITTMDSFNQGPGFGDLLAFSPDDSTLAFVADYPLGGGDPNNAYAVWTVPTTGTGGTRLFGVPTDADLDAFQVGWAPDGAAVFARADYVTNNEGELFGTSDLTTADQAVAGLLRVDAPMDGDVLGFLVATIP
jgi:Tol biopolymer transport system component